MENAIVLQYHVSADDFTRAGEASSDVKGKLKQLGISPEQQNENQIYKSRKRK